MLLALVIEVAVKSSLVAATALLLALGFKHLPPSQRAWMAHLGLLLALLMPLQAVIGPRFEVSPLGNLGQTAPHDALAAPPVAMQSTVADVMWPTAAWNLLLVGYALIAAGILIALFLGLAKLFLLQRAASVMTDATWLCALARTQERCGMKQGVALLHSERLVSPVSWGLLRPTIMLSPAALRSPEKAEAILSHELAHVMRSDWINLLIARLAIAILWFNPLIWLLAALAHELREEAADDVVLRGDVQASDYASMLVEFARVGAPGKLTAHGITPGKASFKRRLQRVLDQYARRDEARPIWAASCAMFAVALAAPLGAFTTVDRVSKTQQERARLSEEAEVGLAVEESPGRFVGMIPLGATSEWLDEMEREMPDIRRLPADERMGMAALGVTPEWLRGMAEAGFGNLSADQVMGLFSLRITPEYVRKLRAAGYDNLTVNDLLGQRALSVFGAHTEARDDEPVRIRPPPSLNASPLP